VSRNRRRRGETLESVDGTESPRHQHGLRGADHGDAARRHGRGRPQGRAPERRPGPHARLGPRRARAVVEGDRPQQARGHAEAVHAGGPGAAARAGRRRRRARRELPAGRAGEVGPRAGRAPGAQPAAGHAARHRVRPGRAVQGAARVRHADGSDERLRPPDRAGGRAAHAAAVRPRRRGGRHRGGVRGAHRALPPRRLRRRGPGDRPRAPGAAAGHPRARPDRVRPARHRRRPARQPVAEQRPAQRLRHPRRPLGGRLGQRHLDRRAGDAPGRAGRPGREAVVRLGRGAQPPRRGARRRRAEVDRRPRPRRRAHGVRGRRGGHRADLRRGAARERPARRRAGHDHHRRRRGPRPAQDAEPDLPAGRHTGVDPLARAAARPGQRAVYASLGVDAPRLAELRATGVV
jgi:hypothetical protein